MWALFRNKIGHDSLRIDCPVRGVWSCMNPPGHHPDAKDFIAVDENGKPYKLNDLARHVFWSLNVTNVFAWDKEVFAPFDGVIVETVDSCEARETLNLIRDVIAALLFAPRRKSASSAVFPGNHVVMQSDKGIYALFVYLRRGNIVVKEGQRVEAGGVIAAIGNSGNTIQPHLHFQPMEESAPFTSSPFPFVFSVCEIKAGEEWKREAFTFPGNGQVFRTIEKA